QRTKVRAARNTSRQPESSNAFNQLIGITSGITGTIAMFFPIFFAFFLFFKASIGISLDVTVFGSSSPSPFAFDILVNFTSWHRYPAYLLIKVIPVNITTFWLIIKKTQHLFHNLNQEA